MEANSTLPFFENEIKDRMQGIIKVIGVGGGGCNAVRNMYNDQIQGVTYAVCNTDSQSLSRSPVPVKIQLGEGLGAGGNPDKGRMEAENGIEAIEKLLSDDTKMVFVTAGMGGGTGTGAAPVVAGVAKQMGLLTVGVVTIPFFFEKKRKIIKALKGVDELRKNVETTMKNGGGAIMAMGRASGDHRVQRAILDALDSPLLYGNDIGKAKRILFNIYSSDTHPIYVRELQEIDDFFDQLDPNIDVIWGTATDDSLGEDAKVTILATGMENDLRKDVQADIHRDVDDFYEDLIPLLYKPTKVETMGKIIGKEQELDFKVEEAKDPEPAVEPEPIVEEQPTVIEPEAEPIEEPKQQTIVEKWKGWLNSLMKDVME